MDGSALPDAHRVPVRTRGERAGPVSMSATDPRSRLWVAALRRGIGYTQLEPATRSHRKVVMRRSRISLVLVGLIAPSFPAPAQEMKPLVTRDACS